METVCITGILGIITLKVYRGVDLAYFVPTLAMFAVAAFRMFRRQRPLRAALVPIMQTKNQLTRYMIFY